MYPVHVPVHVIVQILGSSKRRESLINWFQTLTYIVGRFVGTQKGSKLFSCVGSKESSHSVALLFAGAPVVSVFRRAVENITS